MSTKELKKQAALKEAIIGAFKKNHPPAISFFKEQLIKNKTLIKK